MSLHDRAEAVLLPTYPERPLALVRGAGSTVWDENGTAYLDLVAGLAVCSLGHGHPAAAQALAAQAAVLGHVSNLFYSEPSVTLAERLCALAGHDRAFLCNSGAEAVEAGIKLARRTGRARGGPAKHEVVCVEGAFHGRTLATLAAGWSAAKREPFEPVPAGFRHVPRNDLAALTEAVGTGTCAVLVEPIQGEGGVWPIDAAWLGLARELCDHHGALLLYDEVQTGIGRCGTWFCAELSGVRPDATAVAKGLAGGFPIGALLASDAPDGGFERGDHATTFGGSPPIAAAALAVLEAIGRESLVENAHAVGAYIARRAAGLAGVDHVRGAGLMLGIELADAPAAEVSEALRDRGILVNAITPTALRLVPPLCLSQDEAERFCATFEDVLSARRDQHATTMV
jgi:acetylornithine/N-succinyldiaminopimelate aminotransferase